MRISAAAWLHFYKKAADKNLLDWEPQSFCAWLWSAPAFKFSALVFRTGIRTAGCSSGWSWGCLQQLLFRWAECILQTALYSKIIQIILVLQRRILLSLPGEGSNWTSMGLYLVRSFYRRHNREPVPVYRSPDDKTHTLISPLIETKILFPWLSLLNCICPL